MFTVVLPIAFLPENPPLQPFCESYIRFLSADCQLGRASGGFQCTATAATAAAAATQVLLRLRSVSRASSAVGSCHGASLETERLSPLN